MTLKKTWILFILGILTISAFWMRWSNFTEAKRLTIDGVVYYRMGSQLLEDISDYNTIPYGQELKASGRPLPDYFFQPLFKHPPLFTLSVAASLKFFEKSTIYAIIPSILCGVLLIPLTYLLGKLLFTPRVGLWACFLVWFDPVNILSSQKIWMDTMIAFWMLLTIYLFAYGLKREKNLFFILSGIACGLALNTKYTGILAMVAIFGFTLLYRKDLFKNKSFLMSLFLPFLMLVPWVMWNIHVYGWGFFSAQGQTHDGLGNLLEMLIAQRMIIAGTGVLLTAGVYFWIKRKGLAAEQKNISKEEGGGKDPKEEDHVPTAILSVIVSLAIIILLGEHILNSLHITFLPRTALGPRSFSHEPSWYYFGRLTEYSIVYFFGIIGLFMYQPRRDYKKSIVSISLLVIMMFFILWGNFQCRYILASLPLFLLLGCDLIQKIIAYTSQEARLLLRFFRLSLFVVLGLSIVHMYYIYIMLCVPNLPIYF